MLENNLVKVKLFDEEETEKSNVQKILDINEGDPEPKI